MLKLTPEHIKAIEACLDVADPAEDIAAEAIDGSPAFLHAKAMEALHMLKREFTYDDDPQGLTEPEYPRTWWDVAVERGIKVEADGSCNGAEFARVGISMINGCPGCGATVAPYNSYQVAADNPYAYCRDCARVPDDANAIGDHHTNVAQPNPVEDWRLPPHFETAPDGRLQKHRDAHREAGTATRIEHDGNLTL